MSERCLAVNHGQPGLLLTLFAVRSRRHSYHSQADSAGSIPVTRSTREKRCSTSESDSIFQVDQRSFASENGTRAIARALSHRGECPWRLSVPKLTVRVRFPSSHVTCDPHAKAGHKQSGPFGAVFRSVRVQINRPHHQSACHPRTRQGRGIVTAR